MAKKKKKSKFGGKFLNPDEDSPIRAIFCLKNLTDINLFDDLEDCFILDFNPFETADLSKAYENGFRPFDESEDLVVLSEKGQVACRDYPHSRHLCVKFPFHTTSHDKYCKLLHVSCGVGLEGIAMLRKKVLVEVSKGVHRTTMDEDEEED